MTKLYSLLTNAKNAAALIWWADGETKVWKCDKIQLHLDLINYRW